jgi:lipoic acid synthetase
MSLPERPIRKPSWLTVKGFGGQEFNRVNALVNSLGLKTVCHEANCPNRGECFGRGTAVFLILGPNCTRNCGFCNVTTGRPMAVEVDEPKRVAQASRELGLRHVVVTSVTRDDLPDGGAHHFARTIEEIRAALPTATIEVLVPDFQGNTDALDAVLAAKPDVFNHNVETVPRLYPQVRPQADYKQSLRVLALAAQRSSSRIKSGLMVGLGETMDELESTFEDLANSRVSLLTIGQYLSPSREHISVERYVSPDEFAVLQREAEKAGIEAVFSGPLVRSSYLADAFLRRS